MRAPLLVVLFAAAATAHEPPPKVVEASGFHWKVLGGHWEAKDGALIGSAGNVQSTESIANGVLELDVELSSGPADREVGIAFRFDNPGGDVSRGTGYALNYSHAKWARVFIGKGGLYTVVPDQRTQDPDGAKNHLKVTLKGKVIDLEVNGKPFAHFEDESFATGSIAFWVDSTSDKVKFSKISFTRT